MFHTNDGTTAIFILLGFWALDKLGFHYVFVKNIIDYDLFKSKLDLKNASLRKQVQRARNFDIFKKSLVKNMMLLRTQGN